MRFVVTFVVCFAALLCASFVPAHATNNTSESTADPAKPEAFVPDAADRKVLYRIEDYFNEQSSFKSEFVQLSSNGKQATGMLYIQRPGRMRLEYAPPTPLLVMADTRHLIYHDKKLEQVTYMNLEKSPAGFLVSKKVSFDDPEIMLTAMRLGAGVIEVTIARKKDPLAGRVTLVFSDEPLALRQWRVVDAHNIMTSVSLYNAQSNIKLDPELFVFDDPRHKSALERNER